MIPSFNQVLAQVAAHKASPARYENTVGFHPWLGLDERAIGLQWCNAKGSSCKQACSCTSVHIADIKNISSTLQATKVREQQCGTFALTSFGIMPGALLELLPPA